MTNNETSFVFGNKTAADEELEGEKFLFICQGWNITEYTLKGEQTFGRPTEDERPSIAVQDRFISRRHGCFHTDGDGTIFEAYKTTNRVHYRGRVLIPGETVYLKDGDELMIPAYEYGQMLLVYASSPARIQFWRELKSAYKDQLTGLGNRDSLRHWWKQVYGNKDYEKAVLFILDVDNFKSVNDSLGHITGDSVLMFVAKELKCLCQYDNQVCRWGGDEFVGIIPGDRMAAEQRLKDFGKQIASGNIAGGISVSIGYAEISSASDPLDIEGLVELADQALYEVKRSGKGGVRGAFLASSSGIGNLKKKRRNNQNDYH